jgi:hypothetical protein
MARSLEEYYTPKREAEALRSMLLWGGVYHRVEVTHSLTRGYHLIGWFFDGGQEKAMNVYPRDEPKYLAFAINPLG